MSTQFIEKPIVVNFFGGPGVGKSTMASMLFSELKKETVAAELVIEFARELVYSDRIDLLQNNQLYVLGKQYERMRRLIGKCNIIITDSPLLLSNSYIKPNTILDSESFKKTTLDIFNSFNNLNFYLKRLSEKRYIDMGRIYDSKEEAAMFDTKILNELDNNGIAYSVIDDNRDNTIQVIKHQLEVIINCQIKTL